MKLSEKIQALRKAKGLSQEELAEKLNVTRQSVSKWELEQANPDIDKIIAMSELFSVATDYLLLDDKNPEESSVKNDSDDSHRTRRNSTSKSFVLGLTFFILGFLSVLAYLILSNIDFARRLDNGYFNLKFILYAGIFLILCGLILIVFRKQLKRFVLLHFKTKKSIMGIIGFFLLVIAPIMLIILVNLKIVIGKPIVIHAPDGGVITENIDILREQIEGHHRFLITKHDPAILEDGSLAIQRVLTTNLKLASSAIVFLSGLTLVIISHIRFFRKKKKANN